MFKLRSHLLPVFLLLSLSLFFFLIDGVFSLDFRFEDFLQNPLVQGTDADYQSAFVRMVLNPELYQHDTLFRSHFNLYPKFFIFVVSGVANILGSLFSAYIALSIVLNIIFWVGLYFLFFYFCGNRLIAAVTAFGATFYPRMVLGTVRWGSFLPTLVIPRNFVFAFVPLLFFFFLLNWRSRSVIYLFFILGILANVHLLTALHTGLIFGLFLFFNWLLGTVSFRNLALSALFFLLAAFYPVFQRLRDPLAASIPEHILSFRVSYLYSFSFGLFRDVLGNFVVPLCFFAAILLIKVFRKFSDKDYIMLSLLIISILLSLLIIPLSATKRFLLFQPLRISWFWALFLYAYSSAFLAFLADRSWLFKAAVPILAFLLVFPSPVRAWSFAKMPFQTVVAFFSENNESRPAVDPELKFDTSIVNQNHSDKDSRQEETTEFAGEKPSKGKIELRTTVDLEPIWNSFLDLCSWVVQNSNVDSYFLIPPQGMSLFRTYAGRSIVVSYKDGAPVAFSADYAKEWYARYKDVEKVYKEGSGEQFQQLAENYCVDYIVLADRRELPFNLVFSNEHFWLYSFKPPPGRY